MSKYTFISVIQNYIFSLVLIALLFLLLTQFLIGNIAGDFWEHAAVVNEIMQNGFHVNHPQLPIQAPHAFMNPFAVITALLGNLIGFNAIESLQMMSIINILLIALGMCLIIRQIKSETSHEIISLIGLFFLLGWGVNPWFYSGVFSVSVFPYIISYPSAFSFGLTLISFSVSVNQFNAKSKVGKYLQPILVSAILLSHPLTFIFWALLNGSYFISTYSIELKDRIQWLLLVSSGVILSFFWPLYPLFDLLFLQVGVFDSANADVFHSFFNPIFPSIVWFLILIPELIQKRNRWILLTLLGILAVVIYGYLANKYSYGRLMVFWVYLIYMSLPLVIDSSITEKVLQWLKKKKLFLVKGALILLLLLLNINSLKQTLGRIILNEKKPQEELSFIQDFTREQPLIIADLNTSWMLPAFNAKIWGTMHPIAFVPDFEHRQSDLKHFFSVDWSKTEKVKFLKTSKADYVLVKNSQRKLFSEFNEQELRQVADNQKLILYKILAKSEE